MKTLLTSFIAICLALLSYDTVAQTKVKKNKTENVQVVDVNARLEGQIDSLKHLLDSRNSMIAEMESIIAGKDSIIAIHEDRIGYIDTCTVRLTNRWLYEKYSENDVNEAIQYFDKIMSQELKSEIFIIRELLVAYKEAYKEFITIINEASADPDKEMTFMREDYAKKYITRIKNMDYFKKYFNSQLSIGYLNAKINDALELLNDHMNGEEADFSILSLEDKTISSSSLN